MDSPQMDPVQNPFPPPPLAPYDPDRLREIIRGLVTLVAAICFIIVISFYLVEAVRTTDAGWTRIKEAMQSVLPAVTSVLGTALGFYFGSQKR